MLFFFLGIALRRLTNVSIFAQGFTLGVTPQSGRTLQPQQKDGITIPIEIHGVAKGQANSVKMRWKASYRVAGSVQQEQGEVPALGIV